MKIKKENASKVVVIPRPPRCANPELIPIDTPVAQEAGPQDAPIEAVDPGCGPMNNQVAGPAEGLAGVQVQESVEAAEEKK